MAKRKRMGRPPLPPDERLDWRVQAKLTAAEYEAASELAEAEGITLGRWVRLLIQRSIKRRGKR